MTLLLSRIADYRSSVGDFSFCSIENRAFCENFHFLFPFPLAFIPPPFLFSLCERYDSSGMRQVPWQPDVNQFPPTEKSCGMGLGVTFHSNTPNNVFQTVCSRQIYGFFLCSCGWDTLFSVPRVIRIVVQEKWSK